MIAAVRNMAALLEPTGSDLSRLLRLDVFVKDIYAQDEILALLKEQIGTSLPAMSFLGSEPRHGAEVEMIAIAGGP